MENDDTLTDWIPLWVAARRVVNGKGLLLRDAPSRPLVSAVSEVPTDAAIFFDRRLPPVSVADVTRLPRLLAAEACDPEKAPTPKRRGVGQGENALNAGPAVRVIQTQGDR